MTTDETYNQFLDCENVLWPTLRAVLAKAVDEGDAKLVRRIHKRLAAIARDVSEAT